jgi:hypothetical protein
MTPEQIRNLRESAENVKKNTPIVLERFRKAGIENPDPVLVFTMAQYFDCFERLARQE